MSEQSEQDLVIRGDSLYTIVDGPSWTEAEASSLKLGGHLITINNKQEYVWVAANNCPLDSREAIPLIIGRCIKSVNPIRDHISASQSEGLDI